MTSLFSFRTRVFVRATLLLLATAGSGCVTAATYQFDFGPGRVGKDFTRIERDSAFTTSTGAGWISGIDHLNQRDRKSTDILIRDFVLSSDPATFRVMMAPGQYVATAIMGDAEFGDHSLRIADMSGAVLPELRAGVGESRTLRWQLEAPKGGGRDKVPVDFRFSTADKNWIINGLTIKPGTIDRPRLTRERFGPGKPRPVNSASLWADISSWEDPTKPLVEQFLRDQKSASIEPTGLSRIDYIRLAADNVDFWKHHQNADGAIIDPYRHEEWQYSTPCFALAAAAAVEYLDRDDLLEPAMKAMDWACLTLSEGRAANHHEDFFAPVLAHALPLLKKHAPPDRVERWENLIRAFDPYDVYRATPGHGNWNVVALSGEWLFHKLDLRADTGFVEDSLAGQGRTFRSPYGLYLEGPMAYDHFPRLWAGDMVAHGFFGRDAKSLTEALRRAALTSMFLQSPTGELPLGHRSAHHQWNEAEQCVTYEIYGANAARNGQPQLAGAFKRAAHLALASIKRWQRPTGELWIVKNKVDPAEFHGFEGYSGHSQYNLLPMAMLVIAHEQSSVTENLKELPSPADMGGFVVHLEKLHKIIANASGAYIEIETNADRHYDASGLVRVHFKGEVPQIGPSDILTSSSNYTLPDVERVTAAIGPVWKSPDGGWHSLAEMGGDDITTAILSDVSASPSLVHFQVEYRGDFHGPSSVIQTFDVTPRKVSMTTVLAGYTGYQALEWPVFADNGKDLADIKVEANMVSVSLGNSTQEFRVAGADDIDVPAQKYPNRNGWARLARARFSAGNPMTLDIAPRD